MMGFTDLGTPPSSHVYPPWATSLIKKVECALSVAWQRIQVAHQEVIATADEDQITNKLLEELVHMRKADVPAGFNSNFFGLPVRDGKLPNESGSSIDQMPDITIYLSHPREGIADDRHDGLFYECKVLKDKRNLNLYQKHGIQRFVDGHYAWRMQHAGMIGYLYSPFSESPETALTKYFAKKSKKMTIGQILKIKAAPTIVLSAPALGSFDIAETVHERLSSTGQDNSIIQLRHLWLK